MTHLLPSTSLQRTAYYLLAAVMCLLRQAAPAADVSLTTDGIGIDAGSLGKFTMEYPALLDAGQNPLHKVQAKNVAEGAVTLTYDGGEQVTVSHGANGEVKLKLANVPADVKSVRFEMLVPIGFNQGGSWKTDDKAGDFPKEKATPPHLYSGHARTLTVTNYETKGLAITMPEFSYFELTDNRTWNWATFAFRATMPLAERKELAITIASEAGSAKVKPLLDELGQLAREDWPEKLKSVEELKADVEAEKAWAESLQPPARDPFGGLPGSKEKLDLKATGFFHVEKKSGRCLLVDPAGNAYFHLGLCGVNPSDDYTLVKGRESAFAWLPARDGEFASAFHPDAPGTTISFHLVNMIRKYGEPYTPEKYTARMFARMRQWGFNATGAFSYVPQAVREAAQFPGTAHLPIDEWEGVPRIQGIHEVWDPFDETTRAKIAENMAKKLPGQAADPLIVGYYIVNEPIYENIPHIVPTLKGSANACKRRLVQALTEKYKTVADFNTAWALHVGAFDELIDMVLPVETAAAKADVQDFTTLFFDEYFRFIAETFHKYDTNHLLIGSRLMPGTIKNEALCRTMGKYLDVMSFNYYTYGTDKDLLRRVYDWTGGKPMILSEFFWSASKESGLTGGLELATQQERGLAYRNYVEQSAALGFVVGIEWFTLVDQAATGRWFQGFDGERANTGVIAATDRPWKAALTEMIKTNYDIYKVWFGEREPFAFDDVRFKPPAPAGK